MKNTKNFSIIAIIVAMALAVVAAIASNAGLFWLIQERFNAHLVGSWISALVMFAIWDCVFVGIANNMTNDEHWTLTLILRGIPFVLIILVFIVALCNTSMFFSNKYYNEVSSNVTIIEDGEDGVSAFPNLMGDNGDHSNIPLYGEEEAIKKAETEMGRFSALGSRFELRQKDLTSQNINGSLEYVIPLQPSSMFKWESNEGNHGFFRIDRNNGSVEFVEDSLMTTTAAPFGRATYRIINKYLNGIGINGSVTDVSPEVDDEGNFHYVATVYTKTGLSGMTKIVGIVEVDAKDLTCKFYNLNEIPEYVDRVFPESVFEEYVKIYGKYKHGFWNSVFGQKEVMQQTQGMDVIYIDGVCYYYSGYTSTGADESSVGIMMMNSRTGEIQYHKTFGNVESKAQHVAEGLVQEKEYSASYPLLLKVGGEETYFMRMHDKSGNLVGYAMVSYKDYTKAAVEKTLLDVQASYIKSLATGNSSATLDESQSKVLRGRITAITSEVVDGNTVYYIRVNDADTIYQMKSSVNIDVVFAKSGDKIEINYFDSNSKVESIVSCSIESVKETETQDNSNQ